MTPSISLTKTPSTLSAPRPPASTSGRGYRVFGKIAFDPPGTSRIFMVKEL